METENLLNEKVPAQVLRFRNGNDELWLAFIGVSDNVPVMIATCRNDDRPNNIEIANCYINKFTDERNDFTYNVEFVNKSGEAVLIKNIPEANTKEYRHYTFFISALLENRIPVEKIYDLLRQCGFGHDSLTSLETGILRIIRRYLPAERLKDEYMKCPYCGEKLEIKYGCLICPTDGYSVSL